MVVPIRMLLFLPVLTFVVLRQASPSLGGTPAVCIIGSGIGGASVAHFLRRYSVNSTSAFNIRVFERNEFVGGRRPTINVAGRTFEPGVSFLHRKDYYASNYTKLLNLKIKKPSSGSFSLGIWNGEKFVFETLKTNIKIPFIDNLLYVAVTSVRPGYGYGYSIVSMDEYVESTVNRFFKYMRTMNQDPFLRQ